MVVTEKHLRAVGEGLTAVTGHTSPHPSELQSKVKIVNISVIKTKLYIYPKEYLSFDKILSMVFRCLRYDIPLKNSLTCLKRLFEYFQDASTCM